MTQGTEIKIRNVFGNNLAYQKKFQSNSKVQFENCMPILTSYSLIMPDVHLSVENVGEVKRTIFSTTSPGTWRKNVNTILSRCFKKSFPNLIKHLFELTFTSHNIEFNFILTKPASGKKAYVAPRTI
jgi:DNA mismatch repair ATPase MutL